MFRPLLALGIFMLIIVAVFWYFGGGAGIPPTENASVDTDTATSSGGTGTVVDQIARARDVTRLDDIRQLQQLLQDYLGENSVYPAALDELVGGGYVVSIPQNPTPGGSDYVYTPIGTEPYRFYTISYELEVGTREVSAGEHVANPNGVAQP